MLVKCKRLFRRLFMRRLVSITEAKKDARSLALVMIAAGLLAIVLEKNLLGYVPTILGCIILVLGLTEPINKEK